MAKTDNTKAAEVRDALLGELKDALGSKAVELIEKKLEILDKYQD